MTCIFCADWNQDDPNCGHSLYNGILMPARYATRAWVAKSEIGRGNYLDAENRGIQSARIEHIVRQADELGWKSGVSAQYYEKALNFRDHTFSDAYQLASLGENRRVAVKAVAHTQGISLAMAKERPETKPIAVEVAELPEEQKEQVARELASFDWEFRSGGYQTAERTTRRALWQLPSQIGLAPESCPIRIYDRRKCAVLIQYGPNAGTPATGTPAGRWQHRQANEPLCDACRRGHTSRVRAYDISHPENRRERARAWTTRRRARKRQSATTTFTSTDLTQRMSMFGFRCWMCGGPFEHVDHVKPLAKGGAHVLANLRPACGSCNRTKSDKWPWKSGAVR